MPVMFCGDCGSPRQKAEQRFCAECGAAYDAASATPDPAPPAHVPVVPAHQAPAHDQTGWQPGWQPTGPVPVQQPADYAVPAAVNGDPGAPAPRRSRAGLVVGIGALVLAVGGTGLVGWQVFGPKGGADSPESAATEFVNAVAEQDGVGLLSVVNPGEVAGLDDVYETARERLEDEGLISGGELSGAVDVDFEGLEFDVRELGDGVARVTLDAGTLTASYDPAKLPDRLDFVADEFPEGESETVDLGEVFDEASSEGYELGLTTIEVDGRWYVSLLGTAADLTYQEVAEYQQVRRPDYDAVAEEVEPVVGEDPEEVVAQLVEAINETDVDAVLQQLPEDLARSVRPYARSVEQLIEESGASATVSQGDLDLEVEDIGDERVKVTIEEAEFSTEAYADGESGSGTVTVYDACVDASGSSIDYDGYESSGRAVLCVPDRVLDDVGIDRFYVVMQEVEGGYQLDPVATIASYASRVVEKMPSEIIDEAIAAIETQDGSFFECYVGEYCEGD